MINDEDRQMNEPMLLAKLVDLNEIQETPQLAAAIKRRISAEADLMMKAEGGARTLEDHLSFLEETVCELVDLVASLEMEAVERRRLKRIPR